MWRVQISSEDSPRAQFVVEVEDEAGVEDSEPSGWEVEGGETGAVGRRGRM